MLKACVCVLCMYTYILTKLGQGQVFSQMKGDVQNADSFD